MSDHRSGVGGRSSATRLVLLALARAPLLHPLLPEPGTEFSNFIVYSCLGSENR